MQVKIVNASLTIGTCKFVPTKMYLPTQMFSCITYIQVW